MDMIHPGTYVEFGEDIPEIQEIVGTIGFTPLISERYIDNELLFAGSLNLNLFGKCNKVKYTQGLYNAINFHSVSTWLYMMRILPVSDNMIVPEFDVNGDVSPNTAPYLHPYADEEVFYVNTNGAGDDGITVPGTKPLPAPTFAHTTFGYVYTTDSSTNDIDKVGALQRYRNPLYMVPENREALLYLDEDFGDVTKSLAKSVIIDEMEMKFNPLRESFYDNIPTATGLGWSDLIIGGPGSGGITDPANGYTSKYWPAFTTAGSYYHNFNPEPDSFTPLFTIYGIGRGPWYNGIQISILPKPGYKGVYEFAVYKEDVATATLTQLGYTVDVSFDPESQDAYGDSNYIGTLVNELSEYIRIHVHSDNMLTATTKMVDDGSGTRITIMDKVLEFMYTYDAAVDLTPKPRIYLELRNGSFGGLYTPKGYLDTKIYDAAIVSAFRGEFDSNLTNSMKNDISLIIDNDSTVTVKEEIQKLCELRSDCFGLIDLPKSPSPNGAVTKRNADLSSIVSWQTAIYGNHTLAFAPDEGMDQWFAPSYHLSYLFPTTDINGELWYATAGLKRGVVKSIKKMQYDLNSTDYARWYLNQLNPIINKLDINHIGGQLTAQRFAGPKSNVNIARMVLYVGKTLRKFGEFYIFDLLTEDTLNNIKKEIESFLKEIQAKQGLQDFSVSVTSSAYQMKRKIAVANIVITPTYVLEKLLFSINLTQ